MSFDNLEKLAYNRQLVGAGLGALAGAGVGYGVSRDDDSRSRFRNALLGAGAGGLLGAGVGSMTRDRAPSVPTGKPGRGVTLKPSRAPDTLSGRTPPQQRPVAYPEPRVSSAERAAELRAEHRAAQTLPRRQRAAAPASVNGGRDELLNLLRQRPAPKAAPAPSVVAPAPTVVATGAKRRLSPEQIEALRNTPEAAAKRDQRFGYSMARDDDPFLGNILDRTGTMRRIEERDRLAIRKAILEDMRALSPEQRAEILASPRAIRQQRAAARYLNRAPAAAPAPTVDAR